MLTNKMLKISILYLLKTKTCMQTKTVNKHWKNATSKNISARKNLLTTSSKISFYQEIRKVSTILIKRIGGNVYGAWPPAPTYTTVTQRKQDKCGSLKTIAQQLPHLTPYFTRVLTGNSYHSMCCGSSCWTIWQVMRHSPSLLSTWSSNVFGGCASITQQRT